MNNIDTSAEAVERRIRELQEAGFDNGAATLRALLAERDAASAEIVRLREVLALISDAAPDGWHLNGVFVGQEARAALAGEGRGDG